MDPSFTHIRTYKPSVWVTSSNKLNSFMDGLSPHSPVTHYFLYQTNCISSVGFIKEDNCVKTFLVINKSCWFYFFYKSYNVILRNTPVYLKNIKEIIKAIKVHTYLYTVIHICTTYVIDNQVNFITEVLRNHLHNEECF